ncbi:hypothetical protein EDD21DRAFT_360835 [Dissophora ornata]|nr:hypothetical protein EDD21DRAFT_360835 [Dissophora ornata]
MSSNGSSPHSTPAETDCLVCGSGKSYAHNKILFCDGPGCDIPVHQKCYGVDVVPEGNWYCQRCEDRIPIHNTPSCCCPQRYGAFKRTTIPNQYIHVACARFHPSLNEDFDPIVFNPAMAGKQICCICKSDYGVCSECSVDSCSRVLHVTCAQNEALMTKGQKSQVFCDLHRDIGALSRIMKRQMKDSQSSSKHSSTSESAFHRSTKRSKSYRESTTEGEDEDEDDYESESDEDMMDHTMQEEPEDKRRRNKSVPSSSASSTSGSKGFSKSKRLSDATERRRKEHSSESEEIDVDDTEAVLGSSASGGNGGGSAAHRKKTRTVAATTKESAAESQRRRLLINLDKSKKKQGAGGLGNLNNLSNMPIRTLGSAGPAASNPVLGSGSGGEGKQKLPGISRYGYNSHSGADSPSYPYASSNNLSPSMGSTERFPSSGYNQNNRGSVDASSFKNSSLVLGSAVSSPIIANFSNSGSPIHARLADKQQYSPRSGGASVEETKEMHATIQALTAQVQQLQHQLATVSFNNGTSSSSGPTSSSANPSAHSQVSPHTTGAPEQDLQYKFDSLQHLHGQEKMRNITLRQNLRDLFGFLQVPVVMSGGDSTHGGAQNGVLEWSPDKLDEYVQTLRDAVVGQDVSSSSGVLARPPLDAKRRNMIVDKVLKEMDV